MIFHLYYKVLYKVYIIEIADKCNRLKYVTIYVLFFSILFFVNTRVTITNHDIIRNNLQIYNKIKYEMRIRTKSYHTIKYFICRLFLLHSV